MTIVYVNLLCVFAEVLLFLHLYKLHRLNANYTNYANFRKYSISYKHCYKNEFAKIRVICVIRVPHVGRNVPILNV